MMKSKIKKALAVMTATMMLLGATITSSAAANEHVHAYSLMNPPICYRSNIVDSHEYVISTTTDGNGNVEKAWSNRGVI